MGPTDLIFIPSFLIPLFLIPHSFFIPRPLSPIPHPSPLISSIYIFFVYHISFDSGVDLVFPHHQNEVAQSEAFSGKQFSRYWIHNGFVNINNEKMSKSLKNFKTLRDIVESPVDARAFRYMVVSSQYRTPLNFNEHTLKAALNSLKRIDKLVVKLEAAADNSNDSDDSEGVDEAAEAVLSAVRMGFEIAMCDDLNTPRATASLVILI